MQLHFHKRPCGDYTLGELLRLRREELRISLPQAAGAAGLKVQHITALETGAYQQLPEGLYAKQVLRAYCVALQLPYAKMLAHYERERGVSGVESSAAIFGRERVRRRYFFPLPKWWRGSILVAAILVGFGYIGLRVHKIIAPPVLVIDFPPERFVSDDHTIEIRGTAGGQARLFINASETVVNEDGSFRTAIDLKSGMNDITVRAQKKYGQDAQLLRQVLVR